MLCSYAAADIIKLNVVLEFILWVDFVSLLKIAEIVGYAPIRVYEVATFYSMFNRQPVIIVI